MVDDARRELGQPVHVRLARPKSPPSSVSWKSRSTLSPSFAASRAALMPPCAATL